MAANKNETSGATATATATTTTLEQLGAQWGKLAPADTAGAASIGKQVLALLATHEARGAAYTAATCPNVKSLLAAVMRASAGVGAGSAGGVKGKARQWIASAPPTASVTATDVCRAMGLGLEHRSAVRKVLNSGKLPRVLALQTSRKGQQGVYAIL